MKLSDFLQWYLKEQNISGRELARRCDLAPQTIFNITRGTNKDGSPIRIDTKTLAKLANGLGYSGIKFAEVNGVVLISIKGVTDELDETAYPLEVEDESLKEYLEELRTRPEMRMLFDVGKHMTVEQIKGIVAMLEGFKTD